MKDASHATDAHDSGGGTESGKDSSGTKDSGADACAVTASWDPSMLANLGLWLYGDKGVALNTSGNVVTWDDQSGHGNEASAPGVAMFAVDPGIVNGHNAIASHGSANNLAILDAASLQFGTSGFVIGAVVRAEMGDQLSVYSKGQSGIGGAYSITENPGGDYVFTIGTQSVKLTPTDYTHFHYVIAWSTTEGMQIQSDGVTTVTGPASSLDVTEGGVMTYLLSPGIAASPPDELAEVVAAKGPISCSDIANLTAYFTTKFAL